MKNFNLISTKNKQKVPHCVHGPNLLLEDLNETIPEYRRKYVCSAVRSNECKAFLNFDLDKFKEHHFKKRKNFQNRLIETLKSKKEERRWCVDCSILVLPNELDEHFEHYIKDNLTKKQLRNPTKLISANVDKKEEAQYFFSEESLKIILKTIIRCKFTHVLCIGCPSIHEKLINNSTKLNIKSFLLDIDSRYLMFYSSKEYLCFNMANNYLFEKDKYEKNLNDFLINSSKLLIISDPPFGIMIPALADTLIKLKKKINYFKKDDNEFKMNLMLFHLYFYEKRIQNVLPELKMMDYKISYSNHRKMKQDGNSIARLFTDIDGKDIVLKGLNDYKYCDECERWVHQVSQHCIDCKNCCSKDGKPSGHCAVCNKCVRETYEHCFKCEICTRKGFCKCGGRNYEEEEYQSYDEFNYDSDKDDLDDFKNNDEDNKKDIGILNGNSYENDSLNNSNEDNSNENNGNENDDTEKFKKINDFNHVKKNDFYSDNFNQETNLNKTVDNKFEEENDYEDSNETLKEKLFKNYKNKNFGQNRSLNDYRRDRNTFNNNRSFNKDYNGFNRTGHRNFGHDGERRTNGFNGKDNRFSNNFRRRDDDRRSNNYGRDGDRRSNSFGGGGFRKSFFNKDRNFGRDGNRRSGSFRRDDNFTDNKPITKDDFNAIFFGSGSKRSQTPKTSFKNKSFDKFNKSNDNNFKRLASSSFNNGPFKIKKLD